MALTPYDRLREALRDELQSSPKREFETLLAKATLHVSQKLHLTEAQKEELFQIYLTARHEHVRQKSRDKEA